MCAFRNIKCVRVCVCLVLRSHREQRARVEAAGQPRDTWCRLVALVMEMPRRLCCAARVDVTLSNSAPMTIIEWIVMCIVCVLDCAVCVMCAYKVHMSVCLRDHTDQRNIYATQKSPAVVHAV